MKKFILIAFLLIYSLSFSQTIKVFNDPVKFRNTASDASPTLFMTKNVNDLLTETTFAELQTLLGLGVFLQNVVEDLTPQLGGGLDLNSFDITGTGNINNTGNITTSGTLQSLDALITNDVRFSNYPNTRIDASAVNFLHTDILGNLLSSPVSFLSGIYVPFTGGTLDLDLSNKDGFFRYLDSQGVSGSNNAGALRVRNDVNTVNKIGYSTFSASTSSFFLSANNSAIVKELEFVYSGITSGQTSTVTIQDSDGVMAYTSDIASGTNTGTVLDLDKVTGTYYDMASANTSTTYTTANLITGGFTKTLINAASEPTVTGATKISSPTFQVSTDMYLVTYTYDGTNVEYYFLLK